MLAAVLDHVELGLQLVSVVVAVDPFPVCVWNELAITYLGSIEEAGQTACRWMRR